MNKDKNWIGNSKSVHSTLGASNHSDNDREVNDYYASDPSTINPLFDKESFDDNIWECACGEGHLSREMIKQGKVVYSSDKIDRNFGKVLDFLECKMNWVGDIITNPPYKYAQAFVEKSIKTINYGNKIAMFLKLQFLEGQKRKIMFEKYPPMKVYVFSKRKECGKNGEFIGTSAVAYAWFIWKKGFKGKTIIEWI